MDPTLSWIDASEVRAALAQVRRTAAIPAGMPAAAPHARDAGEGVVLGPVDHLSHPPTVAGRVQALARWVELNLRPQRWFLADDQGLPIHDAGFGDARIGELTHSMRDWRPDSRPSPIEAVTYHLAGERRLVALWVRTMVGPTAIALENPIADPLPVLRRAVEHAFKGKSHA